MKTISVLFITLLMMLPLSTFATEEQRTSNEEKEWTADFLKKHISCILSDQGDSVSIKSDGNVVKDNNSDDYGAQTFSVSVGDRFYRSTEDHSTTAYTLKTISDKVIEVEYESRFNHRSFGDDLITIDTGLVVLECH